MADQDEPDTRPVIIKKYANRRLYNTQSSSYITLDDLARMTRNGVDFQVLDAKSGNDITHSILTQIIMDEEANGEQMLPIGFLRKLIAMYGHSMQAFMPQYLEASMDNFRNNQKKIQDSIRASMGPEAVSKLTETNMAMLNAAAKVFIPGAKGQSAGNEPKEKAEPRLQDELDALRAQMAEMQKKLDELGK